MFTLLKQKLIGEQVWSVDVPGPKRSQIYIWKRNGAYSLRIWSERGSYAQGPGFNWMAVWFDPDQVPALVSAIATAQNQLGLLLQKGKAA